MSEPFFDYIQNNREVISSRLYGGFAEPKDYPRYPAIPLPQEPLPTTSFTNVVLARKTNRNYSSEPLPLRDVGTWLYWSVARRMGETASDTGFLFPSGGGLFPIEIYLIVHSVEGLEPGVYHYHAGKHVIVKLHDRTLTTDEFHHLFRSHEEVAARPPVVACMTMVKERAILKYGALSYLTSLVEAGHRGQTLYLAAAARGLACGSYITPEYDAINAFLGIDGMNEHYMYAVAAGKAA